MLDRVIGGRIAVNPIPYWSRNGRVDKSRASFDEAFADFAKIGFEAVKADVPDGMGAQEYLDWIRDRAVQEIRRDPGEARLWIGP